MSTTTQYVATKTGGSYHKPDCGQVRKATVFPYVPGNCITRYDPTTGQPFQFEPTPCGTCCRERPVKAKQPKPKERVHPLARPDAKALFIRRRGVMVPMAECVASVTAKADRKRFNEIVAGLQLDVEGDGALV